MPVGDRPCGKPESSATHSGGFVARKALEQKRVRVWDFGGFGVQGSRFTVGFIQGLGFYMFGAGFGASLGFRSISAFKFNCSMILQLNVLDFNIKSALLELSIHVYLP